MKNDTIIAHTFSSNTPNSRVNEFIQRMRPLLDAYPGNSWENTTWDVTTEAMKKPGKVSASTISFTNIDASNRCPGKVFDSKIIDLFKAVFLYQQSINPITSIGYYIMAYRCIDSALNIATNEYDPTKINSGVLNLASNIAAEKWAPTTAYHVGRKIAETAKILNDFGLVWVPLRWSSPIPRVDDKNKVGPESDERRLKLLPSPEVINALPELWHKAETANQVITAGLLGLLYIIPCRLSELLALSIHDEFEGEFSGSSIYGFRWKNRKSGGEEIKRIPKQAIEVTKAIFKRIKEVTEIPRLLFKICEDTSSINIIMPKLIEATSAYDGYNTTAEELIESLARNNFKCNSISFPYISGTKTKLSDSLFVTLSGAFNKSCDLNLKLMPREISFGMLDNVLGKEGFLHRSIFSQLGIFSIDGSPLSVNSHQFRHGINTALQRSGNSQIDIARWSGRRNVDENSNYDHMQPNEFLALARKYNVRDPRFSRAFGEMVTNAPVNRSEFNEIILATAHTTEIGFCLHNYVSSPCELNRYCISCNESVCVKGDREKLKRLKSLLSESIFLLQKSKSDLSDGVYGAEKWVARHEYDIECISKKVTLLEDDSIPDGTLIRDINLQVKFRKSSAIHLESTTRIISKEKNTDGKTHHSQ